MPDDFATRLMRSISHDCAANRRAPPTRPFRIVFGALGSVMSPSRMIWLTILQRRRQQPGGLAGAPAHAAQEHAHRVEARRSTAGRLARRQRPRRHAVAGIGILAERALHQPHGRHAVDQRVVDLAVDRDAPVREPFDDVRLPQRTVPVEQRPVPAGRQLEQLADAARLRHRRVPDVVVVVDRVVQRPPGVAQRADRLGRTLAERAARCCPWRGTSRCSSATNSGPASSGGSNS